MLKLKKEVKLQEEVKLQNNAEDISASFNLASYEDSWNKDFENVADQNAFIETFEQNQNHAEIQNSSYIEVFNDLKQENDEVVEDKIEIEKVVKARTLSTRAKVYIIGYTLIALLVLSMIVTNAIFANSFWGANTTVEADTVDEIKNADLNTLILPDGSTVKIDSLNDKSIVNEDEGNMDTSTYNPFDDFKKMIGGE